MDCPRIGSLQSLLCHYKWNYYLQGADIIVHNEHKLLAKFLNGKNANNKVNTWGLELVTNNMTFEWISGAPSKAVDCLSILFEPPTDSKATIKMLKATNLDGPAFNTRSKTSHHCQATMDIDTFKYSTHQENCYTGLNHNDNHSGYYMETPNS